MFKQQTRGNITTMYKQISAIDSYLKFLFIGFLSITIFAMTVGQAVAQSSQITIKGEVTAVTPIYVTQNKHTPIQTCSIQEVPIYGSDGTQFTGEQLIGAIIGGIIGSKVGSGSGNKIAIGTGAVIGANMGKNKNGNKIVGYKQVNVCNTVYETSLEQVLQYYRVSWSADQFNGVVQSNRAYSVGDKITVRLIAQPVL